MTEHDLDDTERRLRAALEGEASSIMPEHRLHEILDTAHAAEAESSGLPRWLIPLAAAVLALVLAGIGWLAWGPRSSTPPAGGGTSTQAPTSPTTGSGTSGPSSSATSDTSASESSATTDAPSVVLPAYFVGPVVGTEPARDALYREFFLLPVSDPQSPSATALASLRRAMNPAELVRQTGYVPVWDGTSAESVDVTSSLITVTLSGSGPSALTAEQERLAVQQLVWSAQAAVGQGNIPVTFEVSDGSTALFGRLPASDRYTRPPKDQWFRDIAPIWVASPGTGQALASGSPITVSGTASVFEATVSWALLRDGRVIDHGFTTASVGGPDRGTYSIDLGTRPDGSYTVRVWEASARDGHPIGTVERPFTVG